MNVMIMQLNYMMILTYDKYFGGVSFIFNLLKKFGKTYAGGIEMCVIQKLFLAEGIP